MLTPTKGRIIVEMVKEKEGSIIILNPTSQIGENVQCCRVIHPGESKFKEGQVLAVSEYSLCGIYKDINAFVEGTVPRSELTKPENQYHIISENDVMAYDA